MDREGMGRVSASHHDRFLIVNEFGGAPAVESFERPTRNAHGITLMVWGQGAD